MINKIKKFINAASKRRKIILFVVLFFVVFLVSAQPAKAVVSEAVATVLGWIAYIITSFVGLLLTLIIGTLIEVAKYSNFIDVEAVRQGWVIVRDLCNMFFILILLVIAFATILRIENYQAKRLLPKLLIMAILINFSKTIAGLIIDFSQVIMLTFVNGFADVGGGNFVKTLQMDKYLSLQTYTAAEKLGALNLTGAILAGLFAAIVSFIVMLVLLVILVIRIVMLWIYVILSPLAFLLAAFPGGQKYASQWWSEFTKQVIVGPVLAFFIWLALATGQATGKEMAKLNTQQAVAGNQQQQLCAGQNQLFCSNDFQTYIITIALLVGGLIVTQQVGGAAGSVAGRGLGWIKKAGVVAGTAALLPVRGAKKLAGFGVDKASEGLGIDLNLSRSYKRLTKQMEENKRSREARIYGRAVDTADKGGFVRSKLALASTGDVAWQSLSTFKGSQWKRAIMGGKWANKFFDQVQKDKDVRKTIISSKERGEINNELAKKNIRFNELGHEITKQEQVVKNKPTDEEINKLKVLKEERKSLGKEISITKKDLKNKKVDDVRTREIDESIKKNTELDQRYRLRGVDVAVAASAAELERQEAPKIAHLENADQLGRILKEAVEEGNQGLISATAKKMTRMNDYNEMMSQLDLGTGREGMHGLAKLFETKGKMSRQNALGLVAEIGGIGKNINHYGAFGATYMESGRWREATQDEMDSAQLAEMLKKQPQAFARDVNRLGLGYYTSKNQNVQNWRPSRAALAFLKLNGEAMARQYQQTGQQNALEHLFAKLDILEKNNINKNLILTIKDRTEVGKGKGVDTRAQIKSIEI